MKLTQMHDGRWLLEHDSGVVLPLTTGELDGLAVRIAPRRLHVERVVSTGSGVGLEVSTEFSGRAVFHLCHTDEILGLLVELRKIWDASSPLTKQDVFPNEEAA